MKILHPLIVLPWLGVLIAPLAAQTPAASPAASATAESVDPQLKEFLNLLMVDPEDLSATSLRLRPEYVKVAELVRAGKDKEAIEAYGDYFVTKMRNPARYGISPVNLDPYLRGVGGFGQWPDAVFNPAQPIAKVKAAADALMQGKVGEGPNALVIGEPGKVNWLAPFKSLEEMKPRELPNPSLLAGTAFNPLVEAYLATRDDRYLQRWKAYMADWALHCDYVSNLHPLLVPDVVNSNVGSSVITMTKILAALSQVQKPDGQSVLDPELTARIVRKILVDEVLPAITYIRSNTHNWTPGAARLLVALYYDEFKVAPIIFREGLRRSIEDNAVTQNLRDGTENEQDPWYNENYLYVVNAISLMDQLQQLMPYDIPYWNRMQRSDQGWRSEIRDHLREHMTYLIHLRTPQNEGPIPFRGGDKRNAPRGSSTVSLDAYADPVNQAILSAVDHPEDGVKPPYNSEWFPYAGFNIIREGWDKDDAYGAMFTSPMPGAYGGYRSRSNNNVFGLAAFGQDLLIDDTTGHYMYPSSPILVDGKNQFFHAGLYKVGPPAEHKVYQISAWTDPAPWRWHDSENFGLMEGIYQGVYGNPDKPEPAKVGLYGKEEVTDGAPKTNDLISDVTHQRLVFFDRHTGLWILVDRLSAGSSHDFEQVWMLPLAPGGAAAFEGKDIKTDVGQKTIRTDAETYLTQAMAKMPKVTGAPKANLTLRQFTDAALQYSVKSNPGRTLPDGRILTYGWDSISAKWKGSGPQQIITAILPREPGSGAEADFKEVKELTQPDGVHGFSAVLPKGKVEFLSAPSSEARLQLGSVTARAGQLLLSGDHGMVLGCKEFAVGGAAVAQPGEDFEFTLSGGKMASTVPIYRPIAPVEIGPDSNVFIDTQKVTMTSATPGVEIRYTLDGTDPTPQSTLYTGPITLTRSARIKARAYRPGLKTNPPQTSGTQATAVSLAVFDKKQPGEPVQVATTVPGLDAKYYQDDWKKLWFELDTLKPQVSTSVPKLWDLSFIPTDNPPVGDAPAPRQKYYTVQYSGFIDVPEEGVYTFHAPREIVYPDVDPGYNLKVEVGDRVIPFGPRTTKYGLQEWYPSTRLHALGSWSVPLKKGKYPFRVTFQDYRTDAAKRLNRPGIKDYIWSGSVPDLKVSGPGMPLQPIPDAWLSHKAS